MACATLLVGIATEPCILRTRVNAGTVVESIAPIHSCGVVGCCIRRKKK